MSALLQGISAPIRYTVGVAVPDHVHNGIPYEADGSLAVENLGAIDHFHQGLPYTTTGRLTVAVNGAVLRIASGGGPFTAAGNLVIGAGAVEHYSLGVPYTATNQIAMVAA
jgi:hypothetical protein